MTSDNLTIARFRRIAANIFQRIGSIQLNNSRLPKELDTLAADSPSPLQRADELRDAAAFVAAAEQYALAHEQEPGRDDILVQLGNMQKDAGNWHAAERAYRDALTLADLPDTHLQLGHLLKSMGNRVGAFACYQRAATLDPNSPDALCELAQYGDFEGQQRLFASGVRHGSMDALLTLSHSVAAMRAEIDRLGRLLPDITAAAAFPIAHYDRYRALFQIPMHGPPPPGWHITVVLLAERETIETLFRQIAAIQAQTLGDWRLCVLGHNQDRQRVIELSAVADPRICWISTDPTQALATAERDYGATLTDGWILLLAQGATLDRHAFGWFATAASFSAALAFVCDEEVASLVYGELQRSTPSLRATVDYDSLLEANTAGETVVVRASTYAQVPALTIRSLSASRAMLLLSLAQDNRVGHVPLPLVWLPEPVEPDLPGHREGVAGHLRSRARSDIIIRENLPFWEPSQPGAAIAIVICTRDNATDVRNMVHSVRQTAADPASLEIIIIDNGTSRVEDLAILAIVADTPDVRVLRDDGPFNWSHLNNLAVMATEAPLLVFANDDMQMVSTGWDQRLRGLLQRPEIGAVGARLLYPDGTIQHAGVLMGWQGSVIHDGLHEAGDAPGPVGRFHRTRSVGAVTGAFLATTRVNFQAVGGFDSQTLPVAYSDIDYCLKLRSRDLRILWTPAITLYHLESRSRGMDVGDGWRTARNAHEQTTMALRWGAMMNVEPGASPLWLSHTMPFRLIAAPSADGLKDYLARAGSASPWHVAPVIT